MNLEVKAIPAAITKESDSFPRLMVAKADPIYGHKSDLIVMAVGRNKDLLSAFILQSNGFWKVGESCKEFDFTRFQDFRGQVILTSTT